MCFKAKNREFPYYNEFTKEEHDIVIIVLKCWPCSIREFELDSLRLYGVLKFLFM